MALSLTHTFVSAVPDGADTSLVRPSNWNDEHTITVDALSVLGRAANTSGAVAAITAASDGDVLRRSGTSIGFGTIPSSSVTAPGTPTNLIYNSGGAFAGITNSTYDGTTTTLSITASAPTVSGAAPILRLIGPDSGNARMHIKAVAGQALWQVYRANGTWASRTKTVSGNQIGGLKFNGYEQVTPGDAGPCASVHAEATQDFTDAAWGTKVVIQTTPNNSITAADALYIGQDKLVQSLGGLAAAAASAIGWTARTQLTAPADSQLTISNNAASAVTSLTVPASDTLQIGPVIGDLAPSNQVLQAVGVVTGSGTTNQAGANLTIASGQGKGNGTASSVIFQTPSTVGSNNTAQTMATRLTISSSGLALGSTSLILSWTGGVVLRSNAALTLVIGSADSATPSSQVLRVQNATGTNTASAASFTIQGPLGTGTGTPGAILLNGAVGAASGTGAHTSTLGLTVQGVVNGQLPGVVIGSAALATNATDGFLWIAGGAGTPTGTPTAFTGRYPLYWDTTNKKLYIYDGSWLGGTVPGVWV